MSEFTEADTIRILVATDNHVGYEERDPIRKHDSWRTFDEVMNVARKEDVDMVLLAGDLFHDNKPSRQALYQVIRSLRQNCFGDKPCALEFLSDAASVFDGAFPHVNYEDPDINVAIPVFSIHGNHDDPSGDGNFCSLDLLQASGLLNYYGRVPEADNIEAKPILLQKGLTKLALFGLSNVRDERMFRTFRDHKVKWFRPNTQTGEWFNLLAVHQNHHAHTATSYLPENVLPEWLDLVVWGHEHECLVDPTRNPETGFHVMQPGSSVATSLVPGEAVQKHVAVVSVTGKNFKVDKIPLKTVRPFVARELILSQDERFKGLDKKKDNRQTVTRRLMEVVDEMIEEANADWEAIQTDEEAMEDRPLPLIRIKVEYSAPDGGQFECENPQRFSNRFVGKVANTNDVLNFYRKKAPKSKKGDATVPTGALEAWADSGEIIKVDTIVQEFLSAQSLKVLPQGPFGDAVTQYVSKDDKHAVELFVSEHLSGQVSQMLDLESDDQDLKNAMDIYRTRMEHELAGKGAKALTERKRVLKPKPDMWDSDLDGDWENEPNAWAFEDVGSMLTASVSKGASKSQRKASARTQIEDEDLLGEDVLSDEEEPPAKPKRATASRATKAPAKKAAPAKKVSVRGGRGKKAVPEPEPEDEEEDMVMDTDEEPPPPPPPKTRKAQKPRSKAATKAAPAKTRQTKLAFSQKSGGGTQQNALEISDDEISDDDAFEPAPVASRTRKR